MAWAAVPLLHLQRWFSRPAQARQQRRPLRTLATLLASSQTTAAMQKAASTAQVLGFRENFASPARSVAGRVPGVVPVGVLRRW